MTLRDTLTRGGQRPLRFVIAGAANTAFGLAIYPLLLWSVPTLHTHYMIALGIAQAVSLCFAFATYKLGVFRTRGNVAREFGTFSGFYLINYAANWLALPLLVEAGGLPPIIAQLGFTLILIVGSYFWHSRVTFRPTTRPTGDHT
ncbi:MAG: GtrA family protein [Sphingobium sp.]|jgi:putative flippase GtrA